MEILCCTFNHLKNIEKKKKKVHTKQKTINFRDFCEQTSSYNANEKKKVAEKEKRMEEKN